MEAIGDILNRQLEALKQGEYETSEKLEKLEITEEAREKYRVEYDLKRVPSEYEALRIEYIKRRQEECQRCKGLHDCQYEAGGEGFTPIVITEEIGGGKELYFGVKKCRYEAARAEVARERRAYEESGLPIRRLGVRLEEVMSKAEAQRLKHLLGLKKDIYIKVGIERGEEVVSGIGKEIIKRGGEVRYENSRELLTKLRVTNERYHEELREIMGVEVLIIEGIKAEQTRYNLEQLEMIIGGRGRRGLESIVSSEEGLREQSEELRRQMRNYEEIEIRG